MVLYKTNGWTLSGPWLEEECMCAEMEMAGPIILVSALLSIHHGQVIVLISYRNSSCIIILVIVLA